MMHVVAQLRHSHADDPTPRAVVVSVHDSRAEAKAVIAAHNPPWVVLPVTWRPGVVPRRPGVGETLSTMREDAGLVAIVDRLTQRGPDLPV